MFLRNAHGIDRWLELFSNSFTALAGFDLKDIHAIVRTSYRLNLWITSYPTTFPIS